MQNTNKKQLILFVKAPDEGHCKTRLIPLLGKFATTELYKKLVIHCLQRICLLPDVDVAVHIDSRPEHEFFRMIQQTFNVSIHAQQGNDLGERMLFSIQQSLQDYDECVLIGSDCPEIDEHYIAAAFDALKYDELVYGPASDGGYVLIGASRIAAPLFDNIDWSTDSVLQQSLVNAQNCGYRYHLLNTLWDIDTASDYIQHHKRIKELLNISAPGEDSYGSSAS